MVEPKQAEPAGSRVGVVRSDQVRRTNLGAVLQHLRKNGPMSRSDLVGATGLTRNAIGELVGYVEIAIRPEGKIVRIVQQWLTG